MNVYRKPILLLLVWFFTCGNAIGASDMEITTAVKQGIKDLSVKKGAPTLCVVTDAPYVDINGKSGLWVVDLIETQTGCTVGKGNLLFVQRPVDHDLVVGIHNQDTGDMAMITAGKSGIQRHRFNIKGNTAADPKNFQHIKRTGGKDSFSLISILTAKEKGAPYEFLRCCQVHNHLCPGVSAGYMIAQYIRKTYPLKEGERYTWFACPHWCKDDAIVTLLDLTAGKGGVYLTDPTPAKDTEATNQHAGIMVIYDAKAKTGKAVILDYSWDKAHELIGLAKDAFESKGPDDPSPMTAKIISNWALIPHMDSPEKVVSTARVVPIDEDMFNRMKQWGHDPYQVLARKNE